MIEYLTHYYRKGTQPFSSLSALSDQGALRIMPELYNAEQFTSANTADLREGP